MAGLYIHIPFCKKLCNYCDFHFSVSLKDYKRVIDAICTEISLIESDVFFKDVSSIDTIYIGGGTPSILDQEDIIRLFTALSNIKLKGNKIDLSSIKEITIEVNPDDITPEFISILKETPINRISIGIQSFDDAVLKWMNRRHDSNGAKRALELILASYNNVTADLIFGLPIFNFDTILKSLETLLNYNLTHISTYHLTVEDKTLLNKSFKRGEFQLLEDSKSEQQYLHIVKELESKGFRRYEISNFSKEGFKSMHNSSYWRGTSYIGIGPSSHSYNQESRRWNISNNIKYTNLLTSPSDTSFSETLFTTETLSLSNKINEYLLTRLRTIEGISLKEFSELFTKEASRALLKKAICLKDEIIITDKLIKLHNNAFLKCDYLLRELFF